MRFVLSTLAAILFVGALASQEVKPPIEIRIPPSGKLARIESTLKADKVAWKIPAGVDADEVSLKTNRLVCVAPPGRYPISCIGCVDGEPVWADYLLIVEGAIPIPPAPEPVPDEILVGKLAAAFKADAGSATDKNAWKLALWSIYDGQSKRIDGYPPTATFANVLADLQAAVKAQLEDTTGAKLNGLRKAIAAELVATFGDDGDVVMDPAARAKAKALFGRIAKSLELVK